MGSPKQAAALVKILNDIGRSEFPPVRLTQQQVADYTAKIIAMPHHGVQAEFKKLNALTGFDRDESPATKAQRKRIAELEVAVHGAVRTTWQTALTFTQASDLISSLVSQLDATRAGVSQLEALANEQVPTATTSAAPTR
jgi:hypothetical protein